MGLLIIFAVGWVMCHISEGRTAEYRESQKAHRKKALKDLKRKHPSWDRERRERSLKNAARRNAVGHLAYQFRHGWIPAWQDFRHGYRTAREGHEEWRREHPDEAAMAGWWATFKAGLRRARRKVGGGPKPDPDPTSPSTGGTEPAVDTPRPSTPSPDEPIPLRRPRRPGGASTRTGRSAGPTDRREPMTTPSSSSGEARNLDGIRGAAADFNGTLAGTASGAETLAASAMSMGLDKDPETMAHIAAGQEALNTAMAHFGSLPGSLAKHAGGEEYAGSGHAVSDIDALKSS